MTSPRIPAALTGTRAVALAAPVLVAVAVIVNAWGGLMPGVAFWDTGEFQTILPIMGTAHPTGYPTYVLLGFIGNILLTPIGEPAFRITVLSLLAVAVASGATVVLVRRLTGSTIVGMAAGVGLATTPVVWLNATRADPHPIHLLFVALLLVALVRWEQGRRELALGEGGPTQGLTHGLTQARVDRRLVLAAVIFGLAEGNHSLTLLLAPAIALYVLAVEPGIVRRPVFIGACLGAALLTMVLVFLELPIRGGLIPAPLIYGRPTTWDGFWYIVFAQQFHGSVGDIWAQLPQKFDAVVKLAGAQLGALAGAIPLAFLVTVWKAPRYALLTGTALVVTLLFNLSYANADIERYYLGPVLLVWTWLGVLGAEVGRLITAGALRLRSLSRDIEIDSPAARPAAIVAAAIVAVVLLMPTIETFAARRHAADRSGDTGARQWLNMVLPETVIAKDAVLVSWWSTSTTLWYAQKVEGQRPDITIIDDRTMLDQDLGRAPDVIAANLGLRPVYVIRLPGRDTDELTGQFDMTLVAGSGSLGVWRVDGRRAAVAP